MSHTVRINFERIADECLAVCDRIAQRVAGLVDMLDIFNQFSEEDIDDISQTRIDTIRHLADEWQAEIQLIQSQAEHLAHMGVVSADSDDDIFIGRYDLKDDVYDLMRSVNSEVAQLKPQLYAMTKAIKALRKERLKREAAHRKEAIKERLSSPSRTTTKESYEHTHNHNKERFFNIKPKVSIIDSIQDDILKQFTHMAKLSNPNLPEEELQKEGKRMMDETLAEAAKQEAEKEKLRCRSEMQTVNVSSQEIDSLMNIDTNDKDALTRIYDHTSESVVGETLRKQSLKMILNAIKAQGFIVNKNSIVRKKDVVILTARKIGGETAKFNVYLDGRFIYDFQGYEGQACQKDIKPFMKDLQDIYGFTITETTEIWKNPDKIDSQKKRIRISGSNKN